MPPPDQNPHDSDSRVRRLRSAIADLRETGRSAYLRGESAVGILESLSQNIDSLIIAFLEETFASVSSGSLDRVREELAVIAIGGSGRGEVAPYSDLDLLFLTSVGITREYTEKISQVVRDIFDSGFKLGHSVRTLRGTLAMARQDPQFATSLVEARLLWGNPILLRRVEKGFFQQMIRSRLGSFIDLCTNARLAEFQPHGWTAQQLEPDIKNSPGGLRDLHLIRWIGYARNKTRDLPSLVQARLLKEEDAHVLHEAREFLSKIRLELHYSAGKAQEILTRAEQKRIAELWGYTATTAQSPVERFMQYYFKHTTGVARIARRFVDLQRPKSLATRCLQAVMSHRAHGVFLVGNQELDAAPKLRDHPLQTLEDVLKVFELASLYQVRLSPQLADTVRLSIPQLRNELTPEAIQSFMTILGSSASLGSTLREMDDTGVLELVIPQFRHVQCLLQFNQYHHYTVDEHTLRTVEEVCSFISDPTSLGQAYRAIHNKSLLHLALILHDLGKGFEEDHSEVGKRIAEEVSIRLQLPERSAETLIFLVHKHLSMALTAFRFDLSDPGLLIRFSREVGSQEVLRMLYVLTAADIKGVGPETWTSWKGVLLNQLYEGAMSCLSNEQTDWNSERRIQDLRESVLKLKRESKEPRTTELPDEWILETLNTLPGSFLSRASSTQLLETLQDVHNLHGEDVIVRGRHNHEHNTVEYQVITNERLGSGCFSKICGVLAAKHLEILSAQIITSLNDVILDSFHVQDDDFSGGVPAFRIAEVGQAIREVLLGKQSVETLLMRGTRFSDRTPRHYTPHSTEVVIDNESSELCTIVDVFSVDRRGLLYLISCVLRELGLSVTFAKITTHVDQILDVFYVTDDVGEKIRDEERLKTIERILTERIELFHRGGQL